MISLTCRPRYRNPRGQCRAGRSPDPWPRLAPVRRSRRPAPATPTDRISGEGSVEQSPGCCPVRLPPSCTHHGHYRPRAHVLDQAVVEGALAQLRVVLSQKLLRGLGREGVPPRAPRHRPIPRPPVPLSALLRTPAPDFTCTSFRATSWKPFLSKRRTISPTSLRCTPSGFTARKVRSATPE